MEMEVTISLRVSIAEEWPNLNEICLAVKEKVMEELPARVGVVIVERMQEAIRDRLARPVGRRAKKGLGGHVRNGGEGGRCRYRTFRKEGFRSERRQVRTDIGRLKFEVGYVGCCGCGRKLAPILDVLRLKERTGHSESLEAVVSEVANSASSRCRRRVTSGGRRRSSHAGVRRSPRVPRTGG